MDPRPVLRVEGLLVAAGATVAYFLRDHSALLFVALVLAPDLSMAGYLVDSRWGARTYNAVHTYVGPALLGVLGWYVGVRLALVWTAHIGVDRLAVSPLASRRPLPTVGASLCSGSA